MPATVVVGGQYGSEGKGKVTHFLAKEKKARIAIRVGGSNSGHTVIGRDGFPIIFRHLPTPSILPDVICVLGAGSYINVDILFKEILIAKLSPNRLVIDENALVLSEDDLREEEQSSLRASIGSTLSGTGAAVIRRIRRAANIRLAKDDNRLKPYVKCIPSFLREYLSAGERVIIEGTQGFGLSLLHSPHYPYVTSRDTTAAAFVSEVGLSPLDVDEVVLVLRAFPIRVEGNSGPLHEEIDWDTVTAESGATRSLIEYTSVTNRVRRVGRFDPEIVRKAILVNQPTSIVLNHLDYIDTTRVKSELITSKTVSFIDEIELLLGMQIDYLGFGPAITYLKIQDLDNVRIL